MFCSFDRFWRFVDEMSCVEKGQVGLLQQLDGICWKFDGGPRAKCDVCLGHCKFDMLARIEQKGRPFVVQLNHLALEASPFFCHCQHRSRCHAQLSAHLLHTPRGASGRPAVQPCLSLLPLLAFQAIAPSHQVAMQLPHSVVFSHPSLPATHRHGWLSRVSQSPCTSNALPSARPPALSYRVETQAQRLAQ